MAKTTQSFEELLQAVRKLPYKKFATLVQNYAEESGKNFEHELKFIVNTDLQLRLEKV